MMLLVVLGCHGKLRKMLHSFCCYHCLPRVSFSFRLRFEWSLWNLEACRVWWLPLWFLSPSSRATVKVMKRILWAMKQKRKIEMKSGRILEKFSCRRFSLCRYGEKFLAKNKIKFCHVFSLVSLPFVVRYSIEMSSSYAFRVKCGKRLHFVCGDGDEKWKTVESFCVLFRQSRRVEIEKISVVVVLKVFRAQIASSSAICSPKCTILYSRTLSPTMFASALGKFDSISTSTIISAKRFVLHRGSLLTR